MKNNELSTLERIDIAVQSHKFYHQQCMKMEEQINTKINSIFQTDETGVEPSEKDMKETIVLVGKLLMLSTKFIQEAMRVISELDNLTEEERGKAKWTGVRNQLIHLNDKQVRIHARVEEIQQMLMEMYDIDEDTF